MKIIKSIKGRLRHFSHIRTKEPIIVIESDDWGMHVSPRDNDSLKHLGEPSIWSKDKLENIEELETLFQVLENRKDSFANTPFIVPNVIVSNPDFEATKQSKYQNIHLIPLHESHPYLVQKYKQGMKRNVFFPQYHGRFHFNLGIYQHNLSSDNLSQRIFNFGIHGGLNMFKNANWALHSEYINWNTGEPTGNLSNWLNKGVADFERSFGFRPKSHIAPHYVFHPSQAENFRQAGFTIFQGCNMQQFKLDGEQTYFNLPLGSMRYPGVVAFGRNVKFEPCRGRKDWEADAAVQKIKFLFKENIPAVLDSHRINYVNGFANKGMDELDKLMNGLANREVRFMTSQELGEAILNGGVYTNVFDGSRQQITLLNNSWLHTNLRKMIT